MLARSARAARAAESFGEFDEAWRSADESEEHKRAPQSSLVSTATFGVFILVALLIGSMGLSGPSTNPKVAQSGPLEDIRRTIRTHAAVKLNEDFHTGLKGWQALSTPAASSSSDWTFNHGFVQPGRLRLWKDSVNMTDYQLEFVGQIEHKGFGWAYRAVDGQNFYATKLDVVKPGPLPSTDLVRFAVIGGRESARVSLPLPFAVRNDSLYRVQVSVKGDSFSTRVNGQMVDTWSDSRLRAGGVGFFADKGEVASLRWVSVSNRDDMIGRILSYLGFITPIQPMIYYAYIPVVPGL
jgi:hypothetical protein